MYLTEMTLDEVAKLLSDFGEPRYRAKQVYAWLVRGVLPVEMTNLPKTLREKLAALPYGAVSIFQKRLSERDGTAKFLFSLEDENLVEGVLMRYHYGNTVCLSTQVGCRMGCAFCASTLEGKVRDLHAGEMLGQIAAIEKDEPHEDGHRAVTNLVLMGSGEPLDNFENVVRFLYLVSSPDGMNISPRNISVSTCGIVPKIYEFMEKAPHVTLSVSLHAHDDETRSRIMPINRAYPIAELLKAARAYADGTGRRVVFEYALISGVNAAEQDAVALAKRLRGMRCHVNLIPLNPVPERNLSGATRQQAQQFAAWLEREHISATVRREMGTDIEGACGQLRRRVSNELRL
ncbi:MAG: 23S rRNA (adenine(2503)-C(2))-methyltransferase RlmN [Clostridium sp.]|nr:23S rRNA (adenine(2503)-C(2))-methyltransferase RlmN [Clostridium sp.]MDD7139767.1 23S rRNA (adenine(2503)-C(2))-methyltransferase RlmN [Clostridium sp.]MDY6081585.1 23S rRNA (adenine(2503)-C(2))-methyltransferase RlmN [Eubacteriales bacterium]